MQGQSKKFELILTILGLIAIGVLAITLSIIERDQVAKEENPQPIALEMKQSKLVQVKEAYEDYRVLDPDSVVFLSRTFEDGELSEWEVSTGEMNGAIVSELRIHYYDGLPRFVILLETSPSGDWVRETEYYFTANKQLGVLATRLNTFYGNVRVMEQRLYLEGELQDQQKQVYDLDTDEEVSRDYQDYPIQAFSSLEELQRYIGSAILLEEE